MSTAPQERSGVSAAVAAVYSAIVSAVVTVAGTLISLASSAPTQTVFIVLLLLLVMGCVLAVVLALVLVIAEVRRTIGRMRALQDLERCVPQLIRFRRRVDNFVIDRAGNATLRIECEVVSQPGASVPWITFPMLAEVEEGRAPWTSIRVHRMTVDGRPADTRVAFVPRERRFSEHDPYLTGRVVEAGVIRVPVGLDDEHRVSRFAVDLELAGAFGDIRQEEKCYTDVTYVTDDLCVNIEGEPGFQITGSPFSEHKVEAMQVGMELIDTPESLRQSSKCRAAEKVTWQSTDGKLGYRYRIPVRAQE